MQKDPSSLETLDIPSLNLRGLANEFGASMILMMTGIGTSHLITAPVAGGRIFRSENPGPKTLLQGPSLPTESVHPKVGESSGPETSVFGHSR